VSATGFKVKVVSLTGVPVAVGVGVSVTVLVGVLVGVFVNVADCVPVGVLVGVKVNVGVGVFVGVPVEVAVGVFVGVKVNVDVLVGVGVFVGVLVSVSVANGPLITSIINSGGLAPSRLERLIAVLSVEVMTKLYCPSPTTNEVTSATVQVPPLIGPELPTVAPKAGALA
jgi:hypothetical protein